jgi:hypothetical protein
MLKTILPQNALRLSLVTLATFLLSANAFAAQPAHQTPNATHRQAVDNAALDFTLVNNTGYDLAHLYISTSEADEWEEDLLSEPLANGASITISFDPSEESEYWDLRADWLMEDDAETQEYVYWTGLDLTTISKLTLKYDENTGKTSAKKE